MQLMIQGTAEEIATTIAKLETILNVYSQSTPVPIGGGLLEVRIGLQL